MSGLQRLRREFPIVDADGRPTEYFLRWLRDNNVFDENTDETATGAATDAAAALANAATALTTATAAQATATGAQTEVDALEAVVAALSLDDLTDVDFTTSPTDGQVMVYDAGSGLWLPGNQTGGGGGGGGGGGAWELVSSTTITTPVPNVTITDLGDYDDLLVICRSVTTSASGFRLVRVSTNNGASFYSASGDYQIVAASGVETANTAALATNAASSAARTFGGVIRSSKISGSPKSCINLSGSDNRLFVGSVSPINALQISDTGGNLTGGTIYVIGRVASAAGVDPVPVLVQSKIIARSNLSTGITLDSSPTENNWLIAVAFTTSASVFLTEAAGWTRLNLSSAVPHSATFIRKAGAGESATQSPCTNSDAGLIGMVEVTGTAVNSLILTTGTAVTLNPAISYSNNYLSNVKGLGLVYGFRRGTEIGTWSGSFTDGIGYSDNGTLSSGSGGSMRFGLATFGINSSLSGTCTWSTSVASKVGFVAIS